MSQVQSQGNIWDLSQSFIGTACDTACGVVTETASLPYRGMQNVNICLVRTGLLPPPAGGYEISTTEPENLSEVRSSTEAEVLPSTEQQAGEVTGQAPLEQMFPAIARIFRTEQGVALEMGDDISVHGMQVNLFPGVESR